MARYAEGTTVPPEKSRGEIENTLKRYGADAFMYGYEGDGAVVQFRVNGKIVRFALPMPPITEFTMTKRHVRRTPAQREAAQEAEIRRRWRALAMMVKAKLEAVTSEIVTFEEEFLAHIVLPDGSTVANFVVPQIDQAYETGKMPPMLPQLEAGS